MDVAVITAVALWKSPYMLFKGWKRLLEDLIGREGPFLETACVPFAGLAILLWPLAVVAGVVASFLSSFFLGLYSAAIVYQVLYCLLCYHLLSFIIFSESLAVWVFFFFIFIYCLYWDIGVYLNRTI